MDDEENMIVTEVGKFISVPSSSESAEGGEDTQKRKKKRKKKEVKLVDNGVPGVPEQVISSHNEMEAEPGIDGIRSIQLPAETVSHLLAGTNSEANSAKGWIRVRKALMINTLETQAEPEPKVVALIEELMNLKREEVAIRRDRESDGRGILVSIEQDAEEVEEKRRNQPLQAVVKYPRPWSSLGSEKEVQHGLITNTRPLIELEMETRADALLRPLTLRERLGDSPHCYTELGPGRQAAPGILRVRMDVAVQAVPEVTAAAAQMEPGLPVNAWTQYVYDLDAVQDAVQSSGSDLPPNYKFPQEKYLEQALEYNKAFNLYTNDYPLLVTREEDTVVPPTATFEPMDALTDVRHVGGQVVAAIAWHPMHSGEVAVLYAPSTRALLQDRAGPPPPADVFRRNNILLWSLRDPLKPRSILTSPREVLAVGWCPVDADILVGACVSGQVVIWDLKGTWQRGTAIVEQSQRRQRALKALQGILQWPDERSLRATNIAPVALSAPTFSHQGAATDLQWLTPHHRLNCDGHYEQIKDNEFSQQFMTCGEDGAVMVWDLNVVPEEAEKLEKQINREDRPLRKYGGQISRFSLYHRTMRPVYKFLPQIANRKSTVIFTALAVETFHIDYIIEENGTSSLPHKEKKDGRDPHLDSLDPRLGVTEADEEESVEWKWYRPVARSPGPLPLPEPRVWLGTEDGVVVLVRWEGFAFDKGEEVTTEAVEVLASCGAVHDGPVVCIQRTPFIPELVLTIGGHVLALWSVSRPEAPVLMRRAPVRLTVAAWSPVRPSLCRVARVDGTLEVWDWLYRSDRPVLEQSLSGEPLTAIANCPFPLPQNRRILSVADYRNALHLFYMPLQFMKRGANDELAMRDLIDRETDLLVRYESWNYKYCTQNADDIIKRKAKIVEDSQNIVNPTRQLTAKLEAAEEKKFAKNRAKAKNRLIPSKDEERMLAILLNKKNLDKTELMAKQQPLRLLQQMEEEKKEKSKLKIKQQQQEFEKIVAALLPLSADEPAESDLSEQLLRQEVQEDVQRVIEEWHQEGASSHEQGPLRTLQRRKVLEEGAARRVAVDVSLYARNARQDRFAARQTLWKTQVAQKAGYPWQTEGGSHLPGGAVSVAHQFLRCTLHQLAPNGVFVQIFHTQVQEKARVEFFKGVAQALLDFPALTPSTPLLLLLETLNTKKSLTAESVRVVCRNMALYLEMVSPLEAGPAPPGNPWQPLLVQMDLFFRRVVLLLPTLEDVLAPVALMPLLLKLPGISCCKAILDPFAKVLSYAIQNMVVESQVVVELCQLCGRAYTRDREKLALTRMLIVELVQALKFKTTMPDTNFIMLINFVIQDTGNCLVQTGIVSCSPDSLTSGTNAAEIMRQHLADALDFLADFHTVSKIKSFCQGDTAGLNEDTLGGALKSGVAQYVALEMSRGARDNRAVTRHLPWLYNAPSSLQQGPKEFLECMGHVRLLSWLLLGGLFQSLSIHAPCTPVPPEASCHVADHIQVILAGFAEQSKASVLHMSSLFHAFILCQLWTVYLEAGANSNPPGSEPHTAQNTILLDFWGKVTPCILQLVAHSKVLAEMVNLHFLSLLEALLEVNASILGKLMPLWTPVLYAHHTQLPGHLQVRLQNCRHFPPTTPTNNSLLAKWLQRLQFKMGQIELQSSAATQFYSV